MLKNSQKILPVLISHEQTAYDKNRFILETGNLMPDITEVSDVLNIDGLLVAMGMKKAFDSLNHSFLLAGLKNSVLPQVLLTKRRAF